MSEQPIYTNELEVKACGIRPYETILAFQRRNLPSIGLSYKSGPLTLTAYKKQVCVTYIQRAYRGKQPTEPIALLDSTYSTEETALGAYHELRSMLPFMAMSFEVGQKESANYHASAGVFL